MNSQVGASVGRCFYKLSSVISLAICSVIYTEQLAIHLQSRKMESETYVESCTGKVNKLFQVRTWSSLKAARPWSEPEYDLFSDASNNVFYWVHAMSYIDSCTFFPLLYLNRNNTHMHSHKFILYIENCAFKEKYGEKRFQST